MCNIMTFVLTSATSLVKIINFLITRTCCTAPAAATVLQCVFKEFLGQKNTWTVANIENEWFMASSREEGHCLPHLMSWWLSREKCPFMAEECCYWPPHRRVCAPCQRICTGLCESQDVELAAENHQVERNVALTKMNSQMLWVRAVNHRISYLQL